MIGVVGQLAGWALGVLQALGYPGLAAIVGLESAGVPLPGETILIAASYLAATGHLSLPLVIGSAAGGAVVGDSLGYLVGRKGGVASWNVTASTFTLPRRSSCEPRGTSSATE